MKNSLFLNTQNQIKKSYEISNFWDKYKKQLEVLLNIKRVINVSLPIVMDNWELKVFDAYRVQHNNSRWVFKWWIRFHQSVNLDEVKALSVWMTIKCWVVDLPLWWWKWWIVVNPKELSKTELERLSRAYVRSIYKYIWPENDVPAPDMNTDSTIMWWMMDEYSVLSWKYVPWSFTWKKIWNWWSKWRYNSTSKWWLYVLERYLELNNDNLDWKKIIIEWLWNVWLWFLKLLKNKNISILWVSDSKWAIYNESWLDINKIIELKESKNSVVEYWTWAKILSNDEILEKECDILVPAAMENRITEKNADNIKSKIILELANWPINPEGDIILNKKNIVIIPDILANSWWVIVSYFEQVQNNTNFYWEEDEIDFKLKSKMQKSTDEVIFTSKKLSTNLRNWAYSISMERILDSIII